MPYRGFPKDLIGAIKILHLYTQIGVENGGEIIHSLK